MTDKFSFQKYGLDFVITQENVYSRWRLFCTIPQLNNIQIECEVSHNIYYGYVLNLSRYFSINKNTQYYYSDELLFITYPDLKQFSVEGPVEEWRQKLLDGFKLSKDIFNISRLSGKQPVYYISGSTVYQYTPDINTSDAYSIYSALKDFRYAEKSIIIGAISSRTPDFFIKADVYDKLPSMWTVHDLCNILKDELEETKRRKEQLWRELGQAIQAGRSWKIPVVKLWDRSTSILAIFKDGKVYDKDHEDRGYARVRENYL